MKIYKTQRYNPEVLRKRREMTQAADKIYNEKKWEQYIEELKQKNLPVPAFAQQLVDEARKRQEI